MPSLVRSALTAAIVFAPAAAVAQYVVPEPPILAAPGGPIAEADAAAIAMMHGVAVVEDVDARIWDGNFEVEGTDAAGNDIEMLIDHDTGAILEIDD